MSLMTEIQRLHDAKDAIRAAIIEKGVYVPENASLDTYSTYIGRIGQ